MLEKEREIAMKFVSSIFLAVVFFLPSTTYPQYIMDSTFVLDSQLNCISSTDSSYNNFIAAVVGTPVNSELLLPNGIYEITVSGQVTINNTGALMPGVLVMYIDAWTGHDDEIWKTVTQEDTIEFVVAQTRERYFHAVLFDPEDVSDNIGQFLLRLELTGWVGIEEGVEERIYAFELFQNYPNPFNSSTNIKYQIEERSHVKVELYNSLGQKVETLVDEEQPADEYTIQWVSSKNKELASGFYFYQIAVNYQIKTRRMLYLK